MSHDQSKLHASLLASSLRAVLPYADNEVASLVNCERADGEDVGADRAQEACETALRVLSEFDKDAEPSIQLSWMSTLPVISTAHITMEVDTQLEDREFQNLIAGSYFGGHFVCVDSATNVPDGLPQCLTDLVAWCKARNYTWVRLDRDGDAVADLPAYEW